MDCIYLCILYVLPIVITFFSFLYWNITSTYSYWKIRGVPHTKPSFPFGNLGDIIRGRKSFVDWLNQQYKHFESEQFFGIFNLNRPVLVLKDPSLVETILMKDFAYFCDRVEHSPPKSDIFAFHIGNLKGHTWRTLRLKLNGAFSNNKLKCFTQQILAHGDNFVEQLKPYEEEKQTAAVDCIGYRFSQSIMASCVFGIESDGATIEIFIKNAKRYMCGLRVLHIISWWQMYVPRYTRLLYFIPQVAKVVDYFKNFTTAIIQVRQQTMVKRNDFLQILLDLNDGETTDVNETHQPDQILLEDSITKREQVQKRNCNEEKSFLSKHEIISQMFNFMSMGLDSIAISIGFLLFDLASNPEEQLKVQQEIDAVIRKFGKLNYEALNHLEYLDCVIQESLRLRNPFPCVTRVCQSEYRIPGSDLVLEKGTTVMVPNYAIHLDPVNYADPGLFIPNRFRDNHFKPNPTYLPFGAGPRICLAFKLVVLQLKVAIAKVMLNFSVNLDSKTELPIQYAPQFTVRCRSGVWVNFKSRKSE